MDSHEKQITLTLTGAEYQALSYAIDAQDDLLANGDDHEDTLAELKSLRRAATKLDKAYGS